MKMQEPFDDTTHNKNITLWTFTNMSVTHTHTQETIYDLAHNARKIFRESRATKEKN